VNYPFIPARHYTPAHRGNVRVIVIHTMEEPLANGTARRVAEWFASEQSAIASAHFCVGPDEIISCVPVDAVAYGAPGANADGVHIEHAGYAHFTAAEWSTPLADAMLRRSAVLVADLCEQFDIPAEHIGSEGITANARGLCGHVDVSRAYGGTHWDPGSGWCWSKYLDLVRQAMPLSNDDRLAFANAAVLGGMKVDPTT